MVVIDLMVSNTAFNENAETSNRQVQKCATCVTLMQH